MCLWGCCCVECLRFSCQSFLWGLLWCYDLYLSLLSTLNFFCVCGVSWWSSFIFLHVAVQISPLHLLKRLFLLHFVLLPPLSNINWPYRLEFISGLSFCSIGLCACFYASTRLFWLQWPCNTVWYQVLGSLLLCSSFSKLLQLFGVIYGSVWISEMFVLYLWNMSWVL